ncbi:MAG: hypothetical protein GY822_13620 [Deltaproteobacteria bacterium]|nr:hypothetical protein [Deltaproteobacteria bacterium]
MSFSKKRVELALFLNVVHQNVGDDCGKIAKSWQVSPQRSAWMRKNAAKNPKENGSRQFAEFLKQGPPHQGKVYKSGDRQTSFAPSLRILADMGENAYLVGRRAFRSAFFKVV